jgi:hypothetical protein
MKRKVCVCLGLLAALCFTGTAEASSGSWFAQGAGTVFNTELGALERWQWVATSNVGTSAAGAPARGHFFERVPGTEISFDSEVTCLNVSGKSARIGITVTRSTNPTRPVGAHTWITMTTIGNGVDALNLVGADGNNAVPPTCPPPSGAVDPFDGTINVREEASPYSWLAQGSGSFRGTEDYWQWVAVSDVGGGNARGHLAERDDSTDTGFTADVTCLTVAPTNLGLSARIGLLITSSSKPLARPVGMSTYVHVTTSGKGSHAVNYLLPDAANYPPRTDCAAPVPGGFEFEGEINIRAAP